MYTLSTSQIQKFVTNDFIPVTTESAVQSAAVDGSIDALRVTAGSGYTDGTYYAAINGDGSSGVVEINVSGGAIVKFGKSAGESDVVTAGTGYTFGTVDLTDVYSDSSLNTAANIGSGTNGAVVPIISPKGGHGSNAEAELGGHFVMMNTKLEQAEGDDITVANDFREVGIVKDPFAVGTTTVAAISTARQTSIVKLASAPSVAYEIDEKITQSTTGAVGRVVEYDATNLTLFYVQERFADYGIHANGNSVAFSGANVITGANSNAAATPDTSATSATVGSTSVTLSSGYAGPELEPNSGDIIYVENRRPISRASDQTEDIKIVVEF